MAADQISQTDRLLMLETPAGPDVLLPRRASIDERISGLFSIDLDLCASLSKASQVKPEQLIGQPFTLRISVGDQLQGPYRYFHGVVNRFGVGARDDRLAYFRAQLVPWLWLLTRSSDCKIFQDKKPPDILTEIFSEWQGKFPFVKFENRTQSGNYVPLDYCVQYRESDFNFVSRIMEQNGIFYYFQHAADGHTLILADDSTQLADNCPQAHEFQYFPEAGPGDRNRDAISLWQSERNLQSGKFVYRDYHFQLPTKTLESTSTTKHAQGGNQNLDLFDFPAEFVERFNKPDQRLDQVEKETEKLAAYRMDEEASPSLVVRGSSNCRTMTSGHLFALQKHFDSAQNGNYVLTSVQHEASQFPDYFSGNYSTSQEFYRNSFACQKKENKFAPPRVTPRPVVDGVQSALVVGKDGEEIWIDKFGRVRVQFFWDRYGAKNEKSTCWVRVAQIWAGKRWGAYFWPRIGQEVLVSFLDGNPDHPVIIGSLYNSDQMPPYTGQGPDSDHEHDPNVSGIKSNSTKGGDGFNELRFNDTKDSEQIFIHGQKDLDVRILNDARHDVGRHEHRTIGIDQDGKKEGNRVVKVAKDDSLHVLQDRIEHFERDCHQRVGYATEGDGGGGNRHVDLEKNEYLNVGGSQHLTVGADQNVSIGAAQSITVGGTQQVSVGQLMALESGQMIHIRAGISLVLEAEAQLSLRVGSNFVDVNTAGVFINGQLLMLNSGGAPGTGPGANPTSPEAPQEKDPLKPDEADNSRTGKKSSS